MDSKNFKTIIDFLMKNNGFTAAYGGWYKESQDAIIVLCLQHSTYGPTYYLNIKIYIHGFLNQVYKISKFLVQSDVGDIFTRPLKEYSNIFDLDNSLTDDTRKVLLESMFSNYLVPLSNLSLSKQGMLELENRNWITLLPAVNNYLRTNK